MVKVNIICVGKLKEHYLVEAKDEYVKRLSRFCKVEILELPEKNTLKEEGECILSALPLGYTIALAIEGKECTSEKFAEKMNALLSRGETINFIIGSSTGLEKFVKARADELLSFSMMTFPHQLIRVILLEQIYRAFMINSGAKYHK